jgi:hypothetical protein
LLTAAPSGSDLYIRVAPIYTTSGITITAYGSADESNPLNLIDAQYSIDVTGRANDVYRRIEVRYPKIAPGDLPDAVVKSFSDLCKQFTAWPGMVISTADEAPNDCSLSP